MRLALCLRGHIRDGLFSDALREFINNCEKDGHFIDVYCHTWSESEAKTSYKTLDRLHLFQVKEGLLRSYFKNRNVIDVCIENDSKIKIYGKKSGVVCKSTCPLIAWKRMWAGQAAVVAEAYKNRKNYDALINTRYDFFTAPICYTPPNHLQRLISKGEKFAFKYPSYTKSLIGVDNFYVGTPENMYAFVYDFYRDLDSIVMQYPDTIYQEELVYRHAHNIGLL